MQVPGGARRAREGAAGQVGARPGRDLGLLGRSRRRRVGIPELVRWACFEITWRHKLSPLVPYRISWFLGEIFARKHKSLGDNGDPDGYLWKVPRIPVQLPGRKVCREVLVGLR